MRTKNSIINVLVSVSAQLLTTILGFITQRIFIDILGTEILGINGLFSNIISMLGIAELGIGTAVIYNLYKPIAENDKEKIKQLLKFYRSCYTKIAIIIAIFGLLVMPFIQFFIGDVNISYNVYIIYILFLVETIVSYFLTYKRSILYADQKNYIISLVHIIYLILTNVGQIFILITTKNYILYLSIKIVMRLLENVLINIATIKIYPYLKQRKTEELNGDEKKQFYTNLRGLVLHKLSWIVIGGTDNIIISKFVGIIWVGFYSNYLMITNTIDQLVAQMFSAITGSVGNVIAVETKKKAFEVYKKTALLQYIIYSTATVGIFCVSQSFIKLWLGDDKFILNQLTVFLICISFFFCGMRRNICTFKDAAGIFLETGKMAAIAAIINLIVSIILAIFIGINGVIIGTIVCYLFLHIFSYPKDIYSRCFDMPRKEYWKELFKFTIVLLISMFITNYLIKYTLISNKILEVIKNIVISIVSTNILTILIYRKTDEFEYSKNLLKSLISKIFKRDKNAEQI